MSIPIFTIVFVLIVIAYLVGKRSGAGLRAELVGICTSVIDQTVKRQKNLDTIVSLFERSPELTNAEIREALRVSSRTAVRYLDKLEKEGKIEQVGGTGRSVTYRLKR